VVGVAFTILGLCDLVYSTKEATFRSPLLQLALGPEGGSSYTFV
jgi:peroxisomal 3,2-trans-enoyl-CoA isomerase